MIALVCDECNRTLDFIFHQNGSDILIPVCPDCLKEHEDNAFDKGYEAAKDDFEK